MSKFLKEGDIIELKAGHEIYADVPEHFIFENRKGSLKITHEKIVINPPLLFFAGRYVVYKTADDGGGGNFETPYPDGHHVYCEKMDDKSIKVDFYQSGGFTAMIKRIKPIGRAIREWIEFGAPPPDNIKRLAELAVAEDINNQKIKKIQEKEFLYLKDKYIGSIKKGGQNVEFPS